MHHAAAANFDPLFAAFERFRFHVDLKTRLGERKIMRPKSHRRVGTEKLAHEEFKRPFQIGDADALVDVKPLDLMKLRAVGGVHFVAAVRGARRDHANRWRGRFHRPDLHGRGVGAQQTAVRQIKRVLFVSRRMIGRSVQRVETMPFRFDVGSIRQRESHAAKNRDGAIEHLGEGMKRTELGQRARE